MEVLTCHSSGEIRFCGGVSRAVEKRIENLARNRTCVIVGNQFKTTRFRTKIRCLKMNIIVQRVFLICLRLSLLWQRPDF